MKTAKVNGVKTKITFRTNSEMYTRFSHKNHRTSQYSADVYNAQDDKQHVVIVATATNGTTIKNSTKVLTAEQYENILDLYDPYNTFEYHQALMNEMGFH